MTPHTKGRLLGSLAIAGGLGLGVVFGFLLFRSGTNSSTALFGGPIPRHGFYTASGAMGLDPILSKSNLEDRNPSIALDKNNHPYVVWSVLASPTADTADIFFTRWNGSNWVGMSGSSADNLSSPQGALDITKDIAPQIKLDNSGNPYVLWTLETGSGKKFLLSHYDGTKWTGLIDQTGKPDTVTTVGNSLIKDFAVDGQGRPAVVFDEQNGNSSDVYLVRFDGSKYSGYIDPTRDLLTFGTHEDFVSAPTVRFASGPNVSNQSAIILFKDEIQSSPETGTIYLRMWDPTTRSYKGLKDQQGDRVLTSDFLQDLVLSLDASGGPQIAYSVADMYNFSIPAAAKFVHWNGSGYVGNLGPNPDIIREERRTTRVVNLGALNSNRSDKPYFLLLSHDLTPPSGFQVLIMRWDGTQYVGLDSNSPTVVPIPTMPVDLGMELDTLNRPNITGMQFGSNYFGDVFFTHWL
ncbi:MAG: hypothetical protein U0517_04150 [Candidatus Andersenbacteria bacterium]